MSTSSLKGAIGVGIQSGKGVPAEAITYIPVLNGNVMGEQLAQTLPPEVGGSYFLRGSYKAGVRGRGDVAMIPRPDTFGWILASLFNAETVAAATTLHDHTFTVSDVVATPPKWLTIVRQVGGLYGERLVDARVGSLRLDISAANAIQAGFQLIAGDHGEVPGEDVIALDGSPFVSCVSDVTSGGAPFIVDRVGLEIGAQLTDNEFHIGSYYLDDITMLQRAVQITCDVRIKSRDLFAKVYRNGGAAPAAGSVGAWSPTIYRSGLTITLRTGDVAPQEMEIKLPGVDFLMMPTQLAGADLIRAQLTAAVTLDADNFNQANQLDVTKQPISIRLRNATSSKYEYVAAGG